MDRARAIRLLVPLLVAGWAGCTFSEAPCNVNADCRAGSYCSPHGCRTDCRDNFGCSAGYYCQVYLGRCAPLPDAGVRPDLPVEPPPDLAPPDETPDLARPPARAYGDVCDVGAQCQSEVCAQNPFVSEDRECTRPCLSSKDCMLGDLCAIARSNQCAPSDIGSFCQPGKLGGDCRGGACLSQPSSNAPAVCTATCQSAADCPAGWSCSAVPGVSGRLCVVLDTQPACSSSTDCWYGAICDQNGRCLGNCRSAADCPLWHRCSTGVCAPNSSGRNGIGDACRGGDDCRGGLCANGTCVGACSVTKDKGQWCPGGYGCAPIDTGAGAYALGCLPAGSLSPGAPCKVNADCVSGLCVGQPGYCSRYCNAAPCPSAIRTCQVLNSGIEADGTLLLACQK